MAKVQLANVAVLDNPSPFLNPFQFEVTFECIEELKEGANTDARREYSVPPNTFATFKRAHPSLGYFYDSDVIRSFLSENAKLFATIV